MKISIISPIFNEEENIHKTYNCLISTIKQLTQFNNYEIIFVNDGSKDNSLKILKELSNKDKNIKIISFIRNFGHEAATTAGINHSTGDATVLIDADLQDPAELILDFEKEFFNGYEIIFGQRTKRLKESFLKKFTSKMFYPFFKFVTKIDMPKNVGDFCMLSKRAVNIFNNLPEKKRFVRGLIYWSGLPKKAIPFIRNPRYAGKTKYNYFKLTIFALENIISFSIMPIYFILFSSLILILLSGIGIFTALIMKFFGRVIMTGWTSLIIIQLFIFASILFCLSLIGLYVGKILLS